MRRRRASLNSADERIAVLRLHADETTFRPRLRVVSPDDSGVGLTISRADRRRCCDCHERIARRRLEALPEAVRCVACQLKDETKRAG